MNTRCQEFGLRLLRAELSDLTLAIGIASNEQFFTRKVRMGKQFPLHKAAEAWRNIAVLYSDAMRKAQILERELVLVLAGLRIRIGELKTGQAYDWAFSQMTRKPAAELLRWIQGSGGNLSPESQKAIQGALEARNDLAHNFFHKYNPVLSEKECERVGVYLQDKSSKFEAAFQLLQPLERSIKERLGIAHRRTFMEDFRKKATDAIASFDDEPE
jgi:hypothetical protein